MAHDVSFGSTTSTYTLSLSSIDMRLFSVIEKKVLPTSGGLLQQLVWRSLDSRPRSANRLDLAREVRVVLGEFMGDSASLLYAYSHSGTFTDGRGTVFTHSGPGTSHGHTIRDHPDYFFSISTGIGFCTLEKWRKDERGQGHLAGSVDCRQRSAIETSNTGRVAIKRRKIRSNLGASFAALANFLEDQSDHDLEVR